MKHKTFKFIVILLGVSLVAQLFLFSGANLRPDHSAAAQEDDSERIAAELSNMTGVDVKEILRLKESGLSWNQVIDILKSGYNKSNSADSKSRNKLLANVGMGEDLVEKLKAEGYTDEEILEAKMIAERLVFQIQEITETSNPEVSSPMSVIDNETKRTEEEQAVYEKIASQFDMQTAVYLMLKLENDFGSMEAVLDEYLFALQNDLDFTQYVNDKEKYQEEKEEKSLGVLPDSTITLSKIEERVLQKIQQDNKGNRELIGENRSSQPDHPSYIKGMDPFLEHPMPTVDDVKPVNPMQEIMDEMNQINPNANLP